MSTKFEIAGRALPELFQNAAQRLLPALIDPEDVGETHRERLVVEAEDLSSLLKEWLTALLNLAQDQRILFHRVQIERLDTTPGKPYRILASVVGELFDPLRHPLKLPMVGLKCDQAALSQTQDVWNAEYRIG